MSVEIPEANFEKWADGFEERMAIVGFESQMELETSDSVFFKEDGCRYEASVMRAYNEIEDFRDEDFLDEAESAALVKVDRREKADDNSNSTFKFVL